VRKLAVGVVVALVVLTVSPARAYLDRALGQGSAGSGGGHGHDPAEVLGAIAERLRAPSGLLDGDGAAFAGLGPDGLRTGDVAVAPPPASFGTDAAPAPSSPPPAQLRSNRFDGVVPAGGTWAVMIGIDDYPGSAYDLKSAVNDVEDVNAALAKMGVPGAQRLMLRDGNANAANIRTAAQWLVAHAGKDATAVFFFAGHIRKLGAGTEALVGTDGGEVRDTELAKLLDGLQASKTWIGLAGCYAGGFTEVVRKGRILTAAAPADRLAYENESFGRSYLVEYMVRRAMMDGDASVVESAFSLAQQGLEHDFPDRVPVQFDAYDGTLDLRPAAPPAPAPQARTAGSSSSPSAGSSSSPPPTSPPPTSSGGSGGSGSSTTSSGSSNEPPKPNDGCATISSGIVHCGG
jgi:hypothetical protein